MVNSTIILEAYQVKDAIEQATPFQQLVADYSQADPMPTLTNLSSSQGIPVGALARFILSSYCASGSAALLEIGPNIVKEMVHTVKEAEAEDSTAARLKAYLQLQGMLKWLGYPLMNEGS